MDLFPIEDVNVVGLAGAGEVGAGWASLLLAKGYRVLVADPAQDAERRLIQAIEKRWPSLQRSGATPLDKAPFHRLQFLASVADMAARSDLVQENGPENPETKQTLISEIDSALPKNRLLLSSSGGIPPSQLQAYCASPERLVLGHPFHPAHLIPLVEVVGGAKTDPAAVEGALQFYRKLGKHPIHLKREIVGHLSNRLQFAVLREASYCLSQGIASASEIDAAMRYGLAPRWALMGSLMTWNMAGGDAGMEGLLARFGADVQRWWDALEPTKLTDQVRDSLIRGADELRGPLTNGQWAEWRDETLIEFFRFLSDHPLPTELAKTIGPFNK